MLHSVSISLWYITRKKCDQTEEITLSKHGFRRFSQSNCFYSCVSLTDLCRQTAKEIQGFKAAETKTIFTLFSENVFKMSFLFSSSRRFKVERILLPRLPHKPQINNKKTYLSTINKGSTSKKCYV